LDPENVYAWFNLGNYYFETAAMAEGGDAEAMKQFRTAMENVIKFDDPDGELAAEAADVLAKLPVSDDGAGG
jgi:hypothetical protein